MEISRLDLFNINKTSSPYWNESAWFSLSVPELGVHGFIYYLFRPNIGQMIGGPALWDSSGMHCHDCLYYEWSHFQTIPEGAQKYDFRAQSSLEVTIKESLQTYAIRYDADGFSAELEWNATSEPHITDDCEVRISNERIGPRTHLDQLGRMTGWIVCRGQRFAIDCWSIRDASSGERELNTPMRGCYLWGAASEGEAFHAMTTGGANAQELAFGFLRRDGVNSSLSRGTRTVIEDGPYFPAVIRLDAEDQLGRRVTVIGRSSAPLMFNGYPRMHTVWGLLEVEIDGSHGWGDVQEFMPLETYRRKARKEW